METKIPNTTEPQHDTKLPYSEINELEKMANRLRSLIEYGYGYTNKPIPPKRMEKLKRKLAEIETKINC
jgi:hypothetical protein